MKPIFLFLFVTTMMTCTIHGQSSQHKENQLPDWAFGGFERPKNVNPVISPIENTKFYCPLTKDSIAWESNDTFNPAATLYNGEIVVLYRAEDKSGVGIGHRTSRLGYATSTDGTHFKREKAPVFYPDTDSQKELEWPGGCEDPRVAVTEDGLYVMMYTQWNRHIPRLAVATSRNLKEWTKHGPAFAKAYDGKFFNLGCKSGSILTEVVKGKQLIKKINGKYFMYWGEEHVFAATSDDLINWTPIVNIDGSLKKLFSPATAISTVTSPNVDLLPSTPRKVLSSFIMVRTILEEATNAIPPMSMLPDKHSSMPTTQLALSPVSMNRSSVRWTVLRRVVNMWTALSLSKEWFTSKQMVSVLRLC